MSLHSVAPSTVVSSSERIALLGGNSSVVQFKVYGYIDLHAGTVFGGLVTNSNVRDLMLENIDMDRDSLGVL